MIKRRTASQVDDSIRYTGSGEAGERGFTLVESCIALGIMMIVALGVAAAFTYAINYNSGGNDRAQAMAVAQQEMELYRNAEFNAANTESETGWILRATNAASKTVTSADGRTYTVVTTITNNASPATLKTIAISVRPRGAGPAWARGTAGAVNVRTLRARLN